MTGVRRAENFLSLRKARGFCIVLLLIFAFRLYRSLGQVSKFSDVNITIPFELLSNVNQSMFPGTELDLSHLESAFNVFHEPRATVNCVDDREPIFVIGGSHSGSSVLQQLIGTHPNVQATPETYIFRNNPDDSATKFHPPEFLHVYTRSPWNETEALDIIEKSTSIIELVRNFFGRFAVVNGKKRWSEKTPQHAWHIRRIHRLFPNSPMVLILRHPGDVIGSLMHKRGWSESRAVDRWVTQYTAAHQYLHAPWLLPVFYEDLVVEPQKQMDAIFRFVCEEPVSDVELKMLESDYVRDVLLLTQGANKQNITKDKEVIRKLSPLNAFASREHFSLKARSLFEQTTGPKIARDFGLNDSRLEPKFSASRIRKNLWLSSCNWIVSRLGVILDENSSSAIYGWQNSEQRHNEVSISGPSVTYLPENVELFPEASGRYLMYFAAHRSKYIRIATASNISGPWHVTGIKALHVDQHSCLSGHVASPQVSVLEDGTFSLFFHSEHNSEQKSFEARSQDGVNFHLDCNRGPVGPFYFAPFAVEGRRYAIAKK